MAVTRGSRRLGDEARYLWADHRFISTAALCFVFAAAGVGAGAHLGNGNSPTPLLAQTGPIAAPAAAGTTAAPTVTVTAPDSSQPEPSATAVAASAAPVAAVAPATSDPADGTISVSGSFLLLETLSASLEAVPSCSNEGLAVKVTNSSGALVTLAALSAAPVSSLSASDGINSWNCDFAYTAELPSSSSTYTFDAFSQDVSSILPDLVSVNTSQLVGGVGPSLKTSFCPECTSPPTS